jgi:hypothetical protein
MLTKMKLRESYDYVGQQTWINDDFQLADLSASLNLFEWEDFTRTSIEPKHFEVYALVSGLPFSLEFQNYIVRIQNEIDGLIGDAVRYWVEPANLGIEYCVFKWPNDPVLSTIVDNVNASLDGLTFQSYDLSFNGIQINKDGCIILKGFSEDVLRIRADVKARYPGLPSRQSNWAHVPIGRLLQPVGSTVFSKLKKYVRYSQDQHSITEYVSNVKFVHETQWYMKTHKILRVINGD